MGDSDPTSTRIPDLNRTQAATGVGALSPSTGAGTTFEPGQTISNRYTVIKLLGAGGMGAVYQAWDQSLGMAVALKLVRLETAADPLEARQIEERFKRELKLARQVSHPNVVRIHDIGEVGEARYLTMAYVQGTDLAGLIHQQGAMPVGRALPIAKQVAAGLAAAHAAGVVHRDLKPANIMVTGEDQALLTDFGIARSVQAATLHTLPGSILGTLEYMAPEQAQGDVADARADVFAFGLILFEMLTGRRARGGSGGTLSELIARIQRDVPPVRSIAPEVPADLEQIVARCLQADPKSRYTDAAAILADLEQLGADGHRLVPVPKRRRGSLAAAAALAALALVGSTYWVTVRRTPVASPAPRDPVSVLIADFDNQARDPIFQGSLEQALGIAIEGASFITAYPRSDASGIAGQLRPGTGLDEAAARLVALREGIRIVLAGNIVPDGSGYQLRVKAIDPARPEPVAVLEASASGKGAVLEAVDRLAGQVRAELGDTSPSRHSDAETFSAASLEAVRSYTIAQSLAADQKDEEAIAHYRAAIAHDPNFGRAYAGWANSALYLGRRQEAEDQWKKAIALMDRMTEREKYRTLGQYYVAVARNYDKAIENFSELVQRYPADRAGHNNLALAYFYTLNFAKAMEHGQRAIQLYPKSFKFRANYALYAMYAGEFATAARTAEALVKENPKFETAYLPLAMAALADGRLADARRHYEAAASAGDPGASLAAAGLADVALLEGRFDEAVKVLAPAVARDQSENNNTAAAAKWIALADAHAASGRETPARDAVQAAVELGRDDATLVGAARAFIQLGQAREPAKIAAELNGGLQPHTRAFGKLLDGELAMKAGRHADALARLREARDLADLWLVREALGRAYFLAGQYPEALSEFDLCLKRQGEATAVFLDDLPTYRLMAPVMYWRARSQEAVGLSEAAAKGFEEFLSSPSRASTPFGADAQRRLAALRPSSP
jgi:tetratricopeptide (TPR) repeat protein